MDPDPFIFGPTDPDPDPTCNNVLFHYYFHLEQNINQNQQIQVGSRIFQLSRIRILGQFFGSSSLIERKLLVEKQQYQFTYLYIGATKINYTVAPCFMLLWYEAAFLASL